MIWIAHNNKSFKCKGHNDPGRGAPACGSNERETATYGHLLVDYVQRKVDAKVCDYFLACVVEEVHHEENAVGDCQRNEIGDRGGARQLGAAEHFQRKQIANDAYEANSRGEINVYFADHSLHATFRNAFGLTQARVNVGHFFCMQFSRGIKTCSIDIIVD